MCCGCCTVFHDTNRQVTFLIKPQLNPLFESKVKMKMKRKKHTECSNLWIKWGRKNWTIDKNGQARMKKKCEEKKTEQIHVQKINFWQNNIWCITKLLKKGHMYIHLRGKNPILLSYTRMAGINTNGRKMETTTMSKYQVTHTHTLTLAQPYQ